VSDPAVLGVTFLGVADRLAGMGHLGTSRFAGRTSKLGASRPAHCVDSAWCVHV
jgi:hypothetical protein